MLVVYVYVYVYLAEPIHVQAALFCSPLRSRVCYMRFSSPSPLVLFCFVRVPPVAGLPQCMCIVHRVFVPAPVSCACLACFMCRCVCGLCCVSCVRPLSPAMRTTWFRASMEYTT